MRLGRQTMAANQMAAQQRAIDMATNPLANPMLVANSPSALAAVFQTQQGQRDFMANAPMRQAELDAITLQNEASKTMLSPEYRDEQRRNSAIQAFGLLTPEQQNGPIGRYLQSQILPQSTGASPSTQPQTIQDATSNLQALTPNVATILGFDPSASDPREILMEIDRRSETTAPIQGQDLQSVADYVINRSRIEPGYVSQNTTGGNAIRDAMLGIIQSGSYAPGAYTQSIPRAAQQFQRSGEAMRYTGRAF
jgi:hypothetical protein